VRVAQEKPSVAHPFQGDSTPLDNPAGPGRAPGAAVLVVLRVLRALGVGTATARLPAEQAVRATAADRDAAKADVVRRKRSTPPV